MVQTSILFQGSQMSQHGFPGAPPSAADNRLTRGSENLRAVTLPSVLGAVIEWYDFFYTALLTLLLMGGSTVMGSVAIRRPG